MQSINRNSVIVTIMVWVITMILFRVNDPYKLQLFLLLSCIPFMRTASVMKFSWIDACVLIICLLDVASCMLNYCTARGVEISYNTTLGVTLYILARNILTKNSCKILFLKLMCLPIAIALSFSILSFLVFKQVLESVGFLDTYPFRYLFSPLGYITNVWSTILFSLLGLLSMCYSVLHGKMWKWVSGLLLCACIISILLSFSRGAYLALGIYVVACLLFVPYLTAKIKIVTCCLLVGGAVFFLFPKETKTTIYLNQTTLQQRSDEGRLNSIKAALKACKSNICFGTGIGSYTLAIDQELNQNSTQKYTSYAPNILSQLLLERGAVGILAYITLFLCICIEIWKLRKDLNSAIIGTIFIAICIKELTLSVVLVTPFILCLCYVLLALLQRRNDTIRIPMSNFKVRQFAVILGSACLIAYEIFFLLYDYNEKCNKKSVDDFKRKKYSEAIKSIECTSEWTPYLINRAKLYMDCYGIQFIPQYLTEAEQALNKARKRNPDDIYIDYLSARLLVLKKDYVRARGELKRMVALYPQNTLYLFAYCKFLCDIGEQKVALPYLKEMLRGSPRLLNMQTIEKLKQSETLLYYDIVVWLKQKKNAKSIAPADIARSAYIAFYMGDFKSSKVKLMAALSQQPNLSIPWLLLGRVNEMEDRLEEAELCFKKYNLLMKGAFSLSSSDMTDLELFDQEQRYLESDYASKFKDWYRSDLMY